MYWKLQIHHYRYPLVSYTSGIGEATGRKTFDRDCTLCVMTELPVFIIMSIRREGLIFNEVFTEEKPE